MICFSPLACSACDPSPRGIRGPQPNWTASQSCAHPRHKGGISDMLCGGHGQLSSGPCQRWSQHQLKCQPEIPLNVCQEPSLLYSCKMELWVISASQDACSCSCCKAAGPQCHPEYSTTVMQLVESGLAHRTPIPPHLCHLLLEVTVKHSGGHQAPTLSEHLVSATTPTLPNSRGHRRWNKGTEKPNGKGS